MEIDKKIKTDFHCNFIPSNFFKKPSMELIQAIKSQGELLNDPTWLNRFYDEAKALSDDGWHDLPAHLQHTFFNNMTNNSKHIIRRYLSIDTDINNREKPFLPLIEELSPEDFKSRVELRQQFVTQRLENEISFRTRHPILSRILWFKRKSINYIRRRLIYLYHH